MTFLLDTRMFVRVYIVTPTKIFSYTLWDTKIFTHENIFYEYFMTQINQSTVSVNSTSVYGNT